MLTLSRDGGFYKSPVVKSLLLLTGASTLLDYIVSIQTHYPNGMLFLRVWALPTPGTWLLAAMILYYCRVLEKRESSTKFLSKLVVSCAFGIGAAGLLALAAGLKSAQLVGSRGALVHTMVGVLLVQYLTTVVSPHSSTLGGLHLPGNIPFYLLSTYFSCSSVPSVLLTFAGMASGLLIHSTRMPVPSLPKSVGSGLTTLLGKDTPPKQYSGASLQVQRQQRMDEMESMFQQFQQRRFVGNVRIGAPVPTQPVQPQVADVEQLMRMGFSREDSVRALQHTGSNLDAAVQLLTVANQR